MTENINNETKGFFTELLELLKLIVIFSIRKLNFQHGLYFTAFLTFGLGDGITSAYMMEKVGARAELNPLMSYVFMEQGIGGMVAVKIWLTLSLLFAAYIVSLKSNGHAFWTVNGFLIALCAGGILAINANLNMLNGYIHEAPEEIIAIFIILTLLLTEVGSYIDHST
jgi:hypothetical protein